MNLNIKQIAIVLVRLASLDWFFGAVVQLFGLPGEVFGAQFERAGYFATQHELAISMRLLDIVYHLGLGSFLLVRAESVADWATAGIEVFAGSLSARRARLVPLKYKKRGSARA